MQHTRKSILVFLKPPTTPLPGTVLAAALICLCLSLGGCGAEQPDDGNSGAVELVVGSLPPSERDITDPESWQAQGLKAHYVTDSDTRLLVLELDPTRFDPALVAAPGTGIAAIDALRTHDFTVVIGSGFVSELNSLAPVGLLQVDGQTLNPVQGYGYTRILGINDGGLGVVHRNDYQRSLFHSALQAGPGIVEKAQLDISEKDLQRPKYFRSFVGLCEERWLVGVSLAPTHLRTLGQALLAYGESRNWQCEDVVNLAGDRQAVLMLSTSNSDLLYHGDPNTYKVSLMGFRRTR
ncbi:MAG: hypothetical protein ACFHXK_15815 [bacterium]